MDGLALLVQTRGTVVREEAPEARHDHAVVREEQVVEVAFNGHCGAKLPFRARSRGHHRAPRYSGEAHFFLVTQSRRERREEKRQ